jgi:hypothetical protein
MVTNLTAWLRRTPQPKKLKTDKGQEIVVGEGRSKWRDAIEVIQELECESVTALDEDGKILRVAHLGDEDGEPAAAAPAPSSLEGDDRDARLARIIVDACDRAAMRHEHAYSMAFDRLYGLVDVLSRRLVGAEKALDQATVDAFKKAQEAAGGNEEISLEGILKMLPMIQQITSKKPPAVTNGASNGASKKAPAE